MGTFTYVVGVASPSGETVEEVAMLVDTGSMYVWLPRSLLSRLGYQPVATRGMILATGEQVERDVAPVRLRIGQEEWPVPCVFGGEDELVLLGAIALEAFGLGVDAVHRTLVPVPGFAATATLFDVGYDGGHST